MRFILSIVAALSLWLSGYMILRFYFAEQEEVVDPDKFQNCRNSFIEQTKCFQENKSRAECDKLVREACDPEYLKDVGF